nr:type 1 glutamine amidotransferase [Leptospiraceae bacterium]
MRSLIVRFADCEGPGILAGILKEKKYTVTYHDAFRSGLELIPSAHQMFDLVVFMGGPASIADPSQNSFFLPYFRLAENVLKIQNSRMIGICLGAQLLAKVLGAEVKKGDRGPEVGFGDAEILHHDPVFQGIPGKAIPVFH